MDMQTAQFAARLWLQTDAAFGMREIPLALPKSSAAPGHPSQAAATVGRFAVAPAYFAQAARPAPRPPAKIAATETSAGRVSSTSSTPQPVANRAVAVSDRAVQLPPIPPGRLDELPAILPADKPRLLAELERQTIAALTPYLSAIATKVVFGDGDPAASLMFIGEGPGIEEDKLGKPFVGRSGQLLDKMIIAMGLNRQSVYIGNVVKLRAAEPDPETGRLRDRPPTPAEVALNISWLHKQIEIVRPKVIVTLGVPALKHLTGIMEGINKVRGTWLEYRGVPLMPTYHPSFVLRAYTPENRAKVWGDLQKAMEKLGLKLPR